MHRGQLHINKFVINFIYIASLISCIWAGGRIFVADTFTIPSKSMEPELAPGDKVIVNKLLFGARLYKSFDLSSTRLQCMRLPGTRGIMTNDIVVFNMPYAPNSDRITFHINYVYCKRCIGLPGDTISIRNGHYSNGRQSALGCITRQRQLANIPDSLIPHKAWRTMPYDSHLKQWTIKNFGPLYIPKKGDEVAMTPETAAIYKKIIEWELDCRLDIDWKRRKVFDGHKLIKAHTFTHDYYFMAGDNVVDSYDSRYFGLVPDDFIIGTVIHAIHF